MKLWTKHKEYRGVCGDRRTLVLVTWKQHAAHTEVVRRPRVFLEHFLAGEDGRLYHV